MRTADARREVLTVLDRWLQQPSRLPVVRVLEGTKPINASPSFFMEAPRLILVIEGRAQFLTITNGQEVTFEILPGQVLFLARRAPARPPRAPVTRPALRGAS